MELIENYIYLAGPYSHTERKVREERFHQINRVAARLMERGWVVYSPISHNHSIALHYDLSTGWDYWGRLDRAFIKHALLMAVLMLPGWRESVGVTAEIAIAKEFNVPICLFDPTTIKWVTHMPRRR